MEFKRVRIVGVSRLHDDTGELSGTYEIRWISNEAFLEGRILAELPEHVWPRVQANLREQWEKLPPHDPMMEFSGKERGIDGLGNLLP